MRLISIDVKPNTALVTWPLAVAMSVGKAKKARYVSELPSISRMVPMCCRLYGSSVRPKALGDDPVGDVAHLRALAHRGSLDEGECLLFLHADLVHQDPLRPID